MHVNGIQILINVYL